jgi:hypothetical protein
MARAYGSSAHLLIKRETTYGQAATGNYIRMPFNRCDLGSEQGLIDDLVLGHPLGSGQTPADRARGLPAQAQARGRGPGRRAGQLRLSRGQEHRRRAHADCHSHQRPRRNCLRMTHNLFLRFALSSVDVRP